MDSFPKQVVNNELFGRVHYVLQFTEHTLWMFIQANNNKNIMMVEFKHHELKMDVSLLKTKLTRTDESTVYMTLQGILFSKRGRSQKHVSIL